MKRGIDTNVLILAHLAGIPGHDPVAEWLRAELRRPDTVLFVTPIVLHEFVHVVTDPRRFTPPLTMSEALATARLWLAADNVRCLSLEPEDVAFAFQLLERYRLGRRRIADTLLVASLLRNEVDEIATTNPADFEVFEGLRVIDPSRS